MKPIHEIKNLLRDEFYILNRFHGMSTICLIICAILLFSCKGIDSEAVTLETPFTIEAIEEGDVILNIDSREAVSLEYSINQGDKQKTTIEDTVIVKLKKGDKMELFGDNGKAPYIQATPKCYIYGNVMSLLSSTTFGELSTIESPHAFMGMFMGNTNIMLHDSKELLLPAKRLSRKCYMFMFDGCTSLTTAPELPAKILAESCYEGMFQGCTSLTIVPELPATVLSEGCYAGMFAGCTSLTTAPELPATVLAEGCYSGMFAGCTSLTTAPELPAMRMEKACYRAMFADCANLSKAPELPAMQLAKKCYAEMFYNCPNLVEPPLLPATELERDCYKDMFENDNE